MAQTKTEWCPKCHRYPLLHITDEHFDGHLENYRKCFDCGYRENGKDETAENR